MHKIIFEIYVKGMPNEVECLNKLREYLENLSKCFGSSTAYACVYKDILIKVIPKVEEAQRRSTALTYVYEPLQQALSIAITVEGDNIYNLVELSEGVYEFAKNCGLMLRLIS
ncbi:MAG: hypothetical protein QXM55_01765 [Ignisphaera sp.]